MKTVFGSFEDKIYEIKMSVAKNEISILTGLEFIDSLKTEARYNKTLSTPALERLYQIANNVNSDLFKWLLEEVNHER